jgi:hypothetical protein
MPAGSPGMEVPDSSDEKYDVVLFGRSGQRVYASFKEHRSSLRGIDPSQGRISMFRHSLC